MREEVRNFPLLSERAVVARMKEQMVLALLSLVLGSMSSAVGVDLDEEETRVEEDVLSEALKRKGIRQRVATNAPQVTTFQALPAQPQGLASTSRGNTDKGAASTLNIASFGRQALKDKERTLAIQKAGRVSMMEMNKRARGEGNERGLEGQQDGVGLYRRPVLAEKKRGGNDQEKKAFINEEDLKKKKKKAPKESKTSVISSSSSSSSSSLPPSSTMPSLECPLCSRQISIPITSNPDVAMSAHMDRCQRSSSVPNSRSTSPTSRSAAANKSYVDMTLDDDDEDEEMKEFVSIDSSSSDDIDDDETMDEDDLDPNVLTTACQSAYSFALSYM